MDEKYERRLKAIQKKKERSVLRRRSFILARNVSLVMLALICCILVGFLIRNLSLDLKSREKVAVLQQTVSAASAPADTSVMQTEAAEETEEMPAKTPEVRPAEVDRIANYQLLYQENNDFCGWIRIPETAIDYPVMHRADDNDFYLSHDFYGQEDVNGLLVLDKRCDPLGDDGNLLIHGHNMKSGFMFGGLKAYKDEAYYEAHPKIWFDTLYHEYTYQIVAVFLSSVQAGSTEDFDFYDYIRIESKEDFEAYVNGAKEASLYETGCFPMYGDHLLTLSTCDYTKADGRLVIVASRKP